MTNTAFILESARLGFRLMQESDLPELIELDTNPVVRAHFIDELPTPEKILQRVVRHRELYRTRGYCDFLLIHKEKEKFAGRAGFGDIEGGDIEVGYVLMPEFWGQGLAQEALRALLDWASGSITAPRIVAYAPDDHLASLNVMAKCGMFRFKNDEVLGVSCTFYQYPL